MIFSPHIEFLEKAWYKSFLEIISSLQWFLFWICVWPPSQKFEMRIYRWFFQFRPEDPNIDWKLSKPSGDFSVDFSFFLILNLTFFPEMILSQVNWKWKLIVSEANISRSKWGFLWLMIIWFQIVFQKTCLQNTTIINWNKFQETFVAEVFEETHRVVRNWPLEICSWGSLLCYTISALVTF